MGNLGITLEELVDLLSRGHEAVFTLDNNEYILQPEGTDFVLYQNQPTLIYLCRVPLVQNDTHNNANCGMWKDAVEAIINEKCFDGKSFMDLLKNIHVDEIF